MTLSLEAPAKINLYLDILSRRDDGYHNICGVMQKVSLSDTVCVSCKPADADEITLTCSDVSVPTGEKNLAFRAARFYLDTCRPTGERAYRIAIRIEKRIPMEAGLAGGSTDAAAVLRALFDMIPCGVTKEELIVRSASLGADVPFCLSEGTQITEGIGECLSPCASLPDDCTVLVCKTAERVSTPAAYRALDEAHGGFLTSSFDKTRFERLLDGLGQSDTAMAADAMFNIFEEAVLPGCPLALGVRERMRAAGAAGAMMSGSGPSVFGIFQKETETAAALLCRMLNEEGHRAFLCRPVK